MRTAENLFFSLDRQFSCVATHAEPDRYRFLDSLSKTEKYIPRGAGLSYVAASFGKNSTSLGLKKFNRILAFDGSTISVEAGVSLYKLHRFLAPKGLCVPVEPGHPQISIGGCIAFNVFGKNQFREGFFETVVDEMEVFHPARGPLTCSKTKNPELFKLTCGGMGLTGIITNAKLRLKKIPSPFVDVRKVRVKNLTETLQVMKAERERSDSLYSFNDFTSFGAGLGAGFVLVAQFSPVAAIAQTLEGFKNLDRKAEKRASFFNGLTRPAFCKAYRALNTTLKSRERMPFYRFNYPVASTPFYFDWYGKKGFVERQILVPTENVDAYIEKFESLVRLHRPQIVFGSCKMFSGSRQFLNFSGEGMVISLDLMPGSSRTFHDALDALNIDHGAIDNIAKDSRLTHETVGAQYAAGYRAFKESLAKQDPHRQFASALSERLCL